MSKAILLIFSVLFSASAFASGVRAAQAQCNRLFNSNERDECFNIISFANSFSEEAINQCNRVVYSDKILACVDAAANTTDEGHGHPMQHCQRLVYENDIINCVAATKWRVYTENTDHICNSATTAKEIIDCVRNTGKVK